MTPDGTEDRLDGPELRRRVEPTIEDKARVLAVAGDDVLPGARQAVRGVDAEEVTQGGPAEPVEMLVRPEQRRLRVETNARLFANLANHRVDQAFARVSTTCRNLGSRFGMIPVVEDEEPVSPLDVHDDAHA